MEFTRVVEEKYVDKKKFFRTLPLCGHVGLPKDKLVTSLVLEDIPLRQEIAVTITSADGNCLFNVVSLVLVGDEMKMSLSFAFGC